MSSAAKCPVCGKAPDQRLTPFCSKRCADVDLGRWLKGNYSIPGTTADDGAAPGGNDAPEE